MWELNGFGKIDAIKKLRMFTEDTFGVTMGLKEAIDAVETLHTNSIARAERDFHEAYLKAKSKGVSLHFMQNITAPAPEWSE